MIVKIDFEWVLYFLSDYRLQRRTKRELLDIKAWPALKLSYLSIFGPLVVSELTQPCPSCSETMAFESIFPSLRVPRTVSACRLCPSGIGFLFGTGSSSYLIPLLSGWFVLAVLRAHWDRLTELYHFQLFALLVKIYLERPATRSGFVIFVLLKLRATPRWEKLAIV